MLQEVGHHSAVRGSVYLMKEAKPLFSVVVSSEKGKKKKKKRQKTRVSHCVPAHTPKEIDKK